MKLGISVCATKSYTYAMGSQARRVAACINTAKIEGGDIIIVGDESKEIENVCNYWTAILPLGWKIHLVKDKNFIEGGENYKQQAQLLIAAMRTTAHTLAIKLQVDYLWSLDSDTLPHANALRVMLDTLKFDGGYYNVAMCPYPNVALLGGRGTLQNQIAEDFLIEERSVPNKLKTVYEECEKRVSGKKLPYWDCIHDDKTIFRTAKWVDAEEFQQKYLKFYDKNKIQKLHEKEHKRFIRLKEKIKSCAPIGNVFALNSKKWRKRGWLENAYPAIGKGSIVPTDWVGFGCTLMDSKALQLAYFEGYDGAGTEDLYIGWNRWYPNGIKMAVLPHCPADHVIWAKKKGGSEKEYTLYNMYHETEGECVGHIRTRESKWTPEKYI
jgi:hypothetical protein